MAASKGRKNGKKRSQTRMSPQKQAERLEEKKTKKKKNFLLAGFEVTDPISLIGFVLMILGFLFAMLESSFGLYCYPITFIGALMCLIRTKPDTTPNKISFVVYIIYCLAVIYLWVGCLQGSI